MVSSSNFLDLDLDKQKKIKLGLDLQGGSYLLLELDNEPVIKQKLQSKLLEIKDYFKKNKIKILSLKLDDKLIKLKVSKDDVEKYYGGNYPRAIADVYSDIAHGVITGVEQVWVKEKLQEMLDAMGGNQKDLELLVNYLYFRAVYYDDSDQNIANYLQNINNIRMICNENNVKLTCFTMHGKSWVSSQVYKDAYKDKFKDLWLFDDIDFQLKKWVQVRYGKDYKDTLGDSIHYYPWVFKTWVDEMLGPWLKERFI